MEYGMYNRGGTLELMEYGTHLHCVKIGGYRLWFSYQTCVAFSTPGKLEVVCENVWSPTTGKHLSFIRPMGETTAYHTPFEEFKRRLQAEVLDKLTQGEEGSK